MAKVEKEKHATENKVSILYMYILQIVIQALDNESRNQCFHLGEKPDGGDGLSG